MSLPNITQGQMALDPVNQIIYYKDGTDQLKAVTLKWIQENSNSIDTTDSIVVGGNLTITGDFTVNGTSTTLNVQTVLVEDNFLVLNSNVIGAPSTNSGIEIERGTSSNVAIRWNESLDRWEITNDGSTFEIINSVADRWRTPRTISLSGDVSGSVILDGTEDENIVTTVANDSHNHTAITLTFGLNDATDVTLNSPTDGNFLRFDGTNWINDPINLAADTVGDYVGKLEAGTNVTITNNTGESATPNISVTGNLTSIDSISSPDYVQFDVNYAATPNVGKLEWSSAQGTLEVGLTGGNVELPIGQKNVAYVHNAEATTLTRGTAVYLYGATGDKASVKRADNRYESTSSKIFGIVAEDIAAGGNGFVTTYGLATKLQLGSYNEGDMLWLGESGNMTVNKPSAPRHLVFLGVVERANNGNGLMFVHVQNGYELEELHNVLLPTPNTGEVLTYNGSLWTSAAPIATVTKLDNVGDVVSPSPSSGEFLKWNGTAWVDDFIQKLDEIIDVNAATPSVTQVLQWDGSQWIANSVNASNLSGTTLASGITSSSLTSIGNLSSLTVNGTTTINGNISVSGTMNAMATPNHTTSYELQLSDANKVLYFGSTVTVRVPGSDTNFAVGTSITIIQDGSGTVTILPVLGSGVSLLSFTGATPKTRVQYSAATIVKKSATQWFVFGDIMP